MTRFLQPLCAAISIGCALLASAAAAEPTTRLIVKLKGEPAAVTRRAEVRLARAAEDAGVGLAHVRMLANGAELLALSRPLPPDEAQRVAARLAADPAVAYATPDRRVHALRTANDELIGGQGYLDNGPASIGAFSAWDVTTGSPSIIVAVLDTGVRPHADLAGRLLSGLDMIADPAVATDGDGRDPDPSDPGDWLSSGQNTGTFADCDVRNSSWHGNF